MQSRRNYTYFTKIDLSMMLYCFVLGDESKALTTAMAPGGALLGHQACPVGLKACQQGDKVLAKVPKKILRKLEKPRRGHSLWLSIMAMALWLCKSALAPLAMLAQGGWAHSLSRHCHWRRVPRNGTWGAPLCRCATPIPSSRSPLKLTILDYT